MSTYDTSIHGGLAAWPTAAVKWVGSVQPVAELRNLDARSAWNGSLRPRRRVTSRVGERDDGRLEGVKRRIGLRKPGTAAHRAERDGPWDGVDPLNGHFLVPCTWVATRKGSKDGRRMSFDCLCKSRTCESARVVSLCSSRLEQSARVLGLCSSTTDESARAQRLCASSFDESARTKAHSVCKESRFALTKRVFRGVLSRELFSERVFRDQKPLFQSKKAHFDGFDAQCSSTNGESARSVSPYLLIGRRFVDQEPPNPSVSSRFQ
jgi:hypothetical protein